MGHYVDGCFLKATTKEAAMKEGLAAAEEFAFYNVDRDENPLGTYHGKFRYYDRIFNSEDEAFAFFDSIGCYKDGVVRIRVVSESAQTKYSNKVNSINKKKREFFASILEKFAERTSKTVGCKKCGTRIDSRAALNNNLHCPVCGNWLVSNTIKERYAKFDKQLEDAKAKYVKECSESKKIRYFAKFSVHC